MAAAEIGKQDNGGITRLPFSEEERAVKELAAAFMQEAGLTVREDAAGNLIGRKEGKHPEAPVIMVGSHLDTVVNGGGFDGALGVLAGIEALHSMNERGIWTDHPIEVVAFTNEETTRFPNAMIGSRGMTGALTEADLQQKDGQGTTLQQAMRHAGYDPEAIPQAIRTEGEIKAYVELHIEQGKILEARGLSVGVVEAIYSQLGDKFILEGESGHAGTTPMQLRNDALMAAAEVMGAIEQEARMAGNVATIGQLRVFPGGLNIIPGKVEFTLDLRHTGDEARDAFERKLIGLAERICEQRGIKLTVHNLFRNSGAPCEGWIREAIGAACSSAGLEAYELISGAGHDAMHMQKLCPIGMIFVRSRNGLSHNPEEYSSPEDCGDGAEVLCRTLLKLSSMTNE